MALTKLTQVKGSPARQLHADIAKAVKTHTDKVDNPHHTTKAQVGLGNVPNFVSTNSVSDASDSKFATAGAVKKTYDHGTDGINRANAAQASANTGIAKADAAQKSADSGIAQAKAAQKSADSGIAKANAAQTSANDGIARAKAAQTSANTGIAKADAAQRTANDGVAKANAAQVTANSKMTQATGDGRYVPQTNGSIHFGGTSGNWTTAEFIKFLTDNGAFIHGSKTFRGSWAYSNNKTIIDTGCGNIHLAGCVVEVVGGTTAYTVTIKTSNTSSGGTNSATFIYNNNGSDYSPGWHRMYDTKNKPSNTDVGLSNINNWTSTGAVNDASTSKYATAIGVKTAYDRGSLGITNAATAKSLADAAQVSANSGISKANAAQASANSGIAKADAAQRTANDGVAKANAAKAAADAAHNYADTGLLLRGTSPKLSKDIHKQGVYSVENNSDASGGTYNYGTLIHAQADTGRTKGWGQVYISHHGDLAIRSGFGASDDGWATAYTTKHKPNHTDVGLGNVPNYAFTHSVTDSSTTKFASAGAVKLAYDRGTSGITKADAAQHAVDTLSALKGIDNVIHYGRAGLQFAQTSGTTGTGLNGKGISNPDGNWWSHVLLNHGNSAGYYFDVATSFDTDTIKFRRMTKGVLGGWQTLYSTANKPNHVDVGLGSVNNWTATSSVTDASGSKYATALGTKTAHDRANVAYSRAESAEANAKKHTDAAISKLMGGAPAAALDTIKELADALTAGDNVAGTITANLTAHKSDKSNPHGVTKTQVGLSNINNWVATSVTNDASTTKYATAAGVKSAYDRGSLGITNAATAQARANAAYSLAGTKITKAQGDSYYLGKTAKATGAASGDVLTTHDLRTYTPTTFGDKTRSHVKSLFTSASTFKVSGGYLDALILNGYHDATGGKVNALLFSKDSQRVYGSSGTWGATAWDAAYEFYTTVHKPTSTDVGLGNVPNWTTTTSVSDSSTTKFATASAVKLAYDRGTSGITKADAAQRTANDGVAKANAAQSTANSKMTQATADGRYLNSSGDTFTGSMTNAYLRIKKSITETTDAPIRQTAVANVGGTAGTYFLPLTHQKAQHSQGYTTHVTTGLVKNTSAWGDGVSGFYVGTGGSDGNPTEYFTLAFGGKLKHSRGHEFFSTAFLPTKSHVGLSNVNNWTATSAVNDASTSKYATAGAAKTAYDRGSLGISKADTAQHAVDTLSALKGIDNVIHYGRVGLQFAQLSGTTGTGLNGKGVSNPDGNWWSHILLNHNNSAGYYFDIAASFDADTIKFRRMLSGKLCSWQTLYSTANKPNHTDVGLSNVPNYAFVHSVSDSSTTKFASAGAVKLAYDRGTSGITNAAAAKSRADAAYSLAGTKITKAQGDSYYLGKTAKAVDSDKLDGLNSTDFARVSHTHTSAQVGLGNVPNWTATTSVSDSSTTKFATASAAKTAYDRGSLGITKADAAQNTANNADNGITKYHEFTVGGDANKLYPVVIAGDGTTYGMNRVSISRGYSWAGPSWNTATHKGGCTATFEWVGDGAWGGNEHDIRVITWSYQYALCVGGLALSVDGVVVWLRGGGAMYRLSGDFGSHGTVTVHLADHIDQAKTKFPVKTVAQAEVDYNRIKMQTAKFDPYKLFPVGYLLITTNIANPSTYGYPGTWGLLANDMTLISTNSGAGGISGTNTPGVPVARHSHTGSATSGGAANGRFTTDAAGNHHHTVVDSDNNQGQGNGFDSSWRNSGRTVATSSAGNHTHTGGFSVPNHTHGVSINEAGTANATIDVRGLNIKVYMWHRTA